MMDSRVNSTRVVGEAIAQAARPPPVWLQASTATIYAHRYEPPNDEATGTLGGAEPGRAGHVAVQHRRGDGVGARARRRVHAADAQGALRSAMTMSPDRGGVFDVLLGARAPRPRRHVGRRPAVRLVVSRRTSPAPSAG